MTAPGILLTLPRTDVPDLPGAACVDHAWEFDVAAAHLSGRHAESRPEVAHALAFCRRCPVKAECLAWAMESHDEWAVLGGTVPYQRKKKRWAQ